METAFDIRISLAETRAAKTDISLQITKEKQNKTQKKPKPSPTDNSKNLVWGKMFAMPIVKMLPVLSWPQWLMLLS